MEADRMNTTAGGLAAGLYDASVRDWTVEIEFDQGLAQEAASRGGSILEVACAAGRAAMRLA
jgi:hypothetical protein